jgi:quercetin dioxygenase-like cupin family protein
MASGDKDFAAPPARTAIDNARQIAYVHCQERLRAPAFPGLTRTSAPPGPPPQSSSASFAGHKENRMRIKEVTDVEATHFDQPGIKGVAARVLIGKSDGAPNFCMRLFDIAPGGNTPKHVHAWEHEMFVHAGDGEIFGNGRWHPVKPGNVVFIPADEEHQIRNSGRGPLLIVCLVPSHAPEL